MRRVSGDILVRSGMWLQDLFVFTVSRDNAEPMHGVFSLQPGNQDVINRVTGKEPGFRDGSIEEAQFRQPTGLCKGPGTSITVADMGNHRIRGIDGSNVSTRLGGQDAGMMDGPAQRAQLCFPRYVAENATHMVILEADNLNQVRVWDKTMDQVRSIRMYGGNIGPQIQTSFISTLGADFALCSGDALYTLKILPNVNVGLQLFPVIAMGGSKMHSASATKTTGEIVFNFGSQLRLYKSATGEVVPVNQEFSPDGVSTQLLVFVNENDYAAVIDEKLCSLHRGPLSLSVPIQHPSPSASPSLVNLHDAYPQPMQLPSVPQQLSQMSIQSQQSMLPQQQGMQQGGQQQQSYPQPQQQQQPRGTMSASSSSGDLHHVPSSSGPAEPGSSWSPANNQQQQQQGQSMPQQNPSQLPYPLPQSSSSSQSQYQPQTQTTSGQYQQGSSQYPGPGSPYAITNPGNQPPPRGYPMQGSGSSSNLTPQKDGVSNYASSPYAQSGGQPSPSNSQAQLPQPQFQQQQQQQQYAASAMRTNYGQSQPQQQQQGYGGQSPLSTTQPPVMPQQPQQPQQQQGMPPPGTPQGQPHSPYGVQASPFGTAFPSTANSPAIAQLNTTQPMAAYGGMPQQQNPLVPPGATLQNPQFAYGAPPTSQPQQVLAAPSALPGPALPAGLATNFGPPQSAVVPMQAVQGVQAMQGVQAVQAQPQMVQVQAQPQLVAQPQFVAAPSASVVVQQHVVKGGSTTWDWWDHGDLYNPYDPPVNAAIDQAYRLCQPQIMLAIRGTQYIIDLSKDPPRQYLASDTKKSRKIRPPTGYVVPHPALRR